MIQHNEDYLLTYLRYIMCLLYPVMAAAIMVCLQPYIPRFQHQQNMFIKIIKKCILQ